MNNANLSRSLVVLTIVSLAGACNENAIEAESESLALSQSGPAFAIRKALLITGGGPESPSDRALRNALTDLGFSVNAKIDLTVIASDADAVQIIVISESTVSSNVKIDLSSRSVPIVVLEPSLLDDLKMVGPAWAVDYGDIQNQTNVHIPFDSGDPLASGLVGRIQVSSAPGKFVWGTPSSEARVAATIGTQDGRPAVFSYEEGSKMAAGFASPARRVGWFAGRDLPALLTDAGWSMFAAAVRWAAQPTALLVVDSAGANASDRAMSSRLEKNGWRVRIRPASSTTVPDTNGATIVIVSESVLSDDLGARLAGVTVPMMISEPSLFDDFGMTGKTWGNDYGDKPSSTRLTITNAGHPVAGGLSGEIGVTSGLGKFVWGKPSTKGQIVAKLASGEAAIFTYESGAPMFDRAAPARRLGWFAGRDEAGRFTSEGWRLFDAAIDWLHSYRVQVLTPVAECVVRISPSQRLGVFGYRNASAIDVSRSLGSNNGVTGALAGYSPMTRFLSGSHRAAFAVPFTTQAVSWKLDGVTALVDETLPECDANCVDPAVKVGLVLKAFPPRVDEIDPDDGNRLTFGDALAVLPPALSVEEVFSLRSSFSWQLTDAVSETDSGGNPALYYASIFVDSRRQIDLLDALQIHYDTLPMFSEDEYLDAGEPTLASLPADRRGGFVYAIIPGATFNALREAALDLLEPTPLFDAVVLRTVPAVDAKECGTATFASSTRSVGVGCPLRSSFSERACAARVKYEYLGKFGFLYRGVAEGEVDVKAEQVYDEFPAEDQAELRGDVGSNSQPLFGRLVRKFVKKVIKVARKASDITRKAITQVGRLFVESDLFTIQLDIRETDEAFGGSASKMVRTWGRRAPGGIDDLPGSGAGAPVSLPGLEVRASNGIFLSTGNTNSRNQATVRVLRLSSPAQICLRMSSSAATLEETFWVASVCKFPTNKWLGRFKSRPGVPHIEWAQHGYLNISAQFAEASEYMKQIANFQMKKALVLVGGSANLMSSEDDDGNKRAYAPCLDLPNWANPIPTVASALGAYYAGPPGGRWLRSKLKPAVELLGKLLVDIGSTWAKSLDDAQNAGRAYLDRGLNQTADELFRLGEAADRAIRLGRENAKVAEQAAEDAFEAIEYAARAVDEGRIPKNHPMVEQAKNLVNSSKIAMELAKTAAQDAEDAIRALEGSLLAASQTAGGEIALAALQAVRVVSLNPAIELCKNALVDYAAAIVRIAGGVIGYAAGELAEVLLDADLIMPDDAIRSRGVASHEYGHYVFCNLMYKENAFKYGAAYTEIMVDTTLGQVKEKEEGYDRTRDQHVYINEGFADFMAGQLVGGVNYFGLPESTGAGNINYCSSTADDCLDNNIGGPAGQSQGKAFDEKTGRIATILHDAFDGQGRSQAPSDGSIWGVDSNSILSYVGNDSANRYDEVISAPGDSLKAVVRNMFARATLVRESNLLGAVNDAMIGLGYTWCQRCELFGIHEPNETCRPNLMDTRPSGLACSFEGCTPPTVPLAATRSCGCPAGMSLQNGTCVPTSCPAGQLIHRGGCVAVCPCACPEPDNVCSCLEVGIPISECFFPDTTGTRCVADAFCIE
jgi:hypothetical protein